jgi:hypothetical protein
MRTTQRQQTESNPTTLTIPETVLSPTAKLVYVFVLTQQATTVDEICSSLRMKRLTLFGVLPSLLSKANVAREGDSVFVSDE